MPAPRYSFADEWLLPAHPEAVYAVLCDITGYPVWWPQVRSVEGIDEDTAAVTCRSVLPYTLRFTMRATRRDPVEGVLEASLDGDLAGSCRWRISAAPSGARASFSQEVTTTGPLLGYAARVGRPLLVLNHHLMMRGGRRGLAGRIAR